MTGSHLAERIAEIYADKCDSAPSSRARHYFNQGLFNRSVEAVRAVQPKGRIATAVVDEARALCQALYTPLSDVIDREIQRTNKLQRVMETA